MPAINFKKEFAEAVESGEKTQTIRKVRKRPIENGDTLYLYTGRRLLRTVVCHGAVPIKITKRKIIVPEWSRNVSMNLVAFRDGFDTIEAFLDFFRKQYDLPFEGVLIWWDK